MSGQRSRELIFPPLESNDVRPAHIIIYLKLIARRNCDRPVANHTYIHTYFASYVYNQGRKIETNTRINHIKRMRLLFYTEGCRIFVFCLTKFGVWLFIMSQYRICVSQSSALEYCTIAASVDGCIQLHVRLRRRRERCASCVIHD